MVSFVVLLELLHSQIVKNRVKLTVKVDFVTHCAEFLRDSLVVLLLLDEIGYIIDWQLKISDALAEPHLNFISTLLIDTGHKLLNLLLKLLWCWSKLFLDRLTIQLDKSDICDVWKVCCEVSLVEFK